MKKRAVYFAIIVLAVLHQDFWFWDDATLVFGVLPVGLAYHALYSVVAGLIWFVALHYAWPKEVEEFGHSTDHSTDTAETPAE